MELPSIPNQAPPTTNVFDRWWVTRFAITSGRVSVSLAPYDGANVLGNGHRRLHVQDISDDPMLAQIAPAILEMMRVQAGRTDQPVSVSVESPNPSMKTRATGIFRVGDKNEVHPVDDLFALAESDPDLAQAFGGALTWVASKVAATE